MNFGVTPALILYSFVLQELKALGWIAVLVFAIAMVLRLARFNVMMDDPNRPEWQKNFFTGMPAPAGAVTSLLPLYLSFLGIPMDNAAPVVLVYLLGLAFLMVSTIPVYSGKTLGKSVPRHWVLPIFVLSVAGFGLLVSFPFEVLTGITVVFLGTIPLGRHALPPLARDHASSPPEPAPVVPPPP